MITLSRQAGTYHATYSGAKAAEIIEAFGTDTIPTAFTHMTPAETVLQRIKALNPGEEVRLSAALSCGHGCGCATAA